MKISVIGAGAWGTALAGLLHGNRHAVTLWAHDPERLEEIRRTGRNQRYLPGIDLPPGIRLEKDLQRAVADSQLIVIAVPSTALRETSRALSQFEGIAVSVTKGIEPDTGLTMSGILRETMPRAQAAALSGPTLAMEVARNIPAAIVAAHPDEAMGRVIQGVFHRPSFRVYRSRDLIGTEMGGALKNIIAIAAGVCDGLGYGDNSKAALLARGLAEMRRLGVACGADPETFSGLSGLGDLSVTCFSRLSRNRTFGERLGRGERLEEILARSITVAEGFPTAQAAFHLAQAKQIETPIINQVHAVLYEGKSVRQLVTDLLEREAGAE
jgi:glycerol-3-phosphate dehydrogenase (NAD(P)+)